MEFDITTVQSLLDISRARQDRKMFMKKRRAAELLAEMHRPPTPPSSDQDSDGDSETKLPRLSSCKEEDKMLAKVKIVTTIINY